MQVDLHLTAARNACFRRTPESDIRPPMLAKVILWLFALALVGATVTAFYLRATQQKKIVHNRPIPRVKVQRPTVRGLLVRLNYPASLEPIQGAEIRPIEAKGFVKKITVDKGDKVKAGQLLVSVDCPEYHARRSQARQGIAAATAVRNNAKTNLDRLAPMLAKAFVSQVEVDAAQATFDSADARVHNEEARLAEVDSLLKYCQIRAPFDGEIAMRFVDVGEQVRPGGRVLLTLIRRDVMRVQVTVVDKDAIHIREGLPAELTVQGLPGAHFHGKVTRFVRAVDRATRSLLVEIEIPNPNGVLRPSMFGRVLLTVNRFARAIIVPATAVLATDAGTFVYVVRDGRVVKLAVKLGHDTGDEVQVVEGLQGREQLIIVGRDLVTEGTVVEVAEDVAHPPAAAAPPPPTPSKEGS